MFKSSEYIRIVFTFSAFSLVNKNAQTESTRHQGLPQPNQTIETSAHYGATLVAWFFLAHLLFEVVIRWRKSQYYDDNSFEKSGVKLLKRFHFLFSFTEKVKFVVHFSMQKDCLKLNFASFWQIVHSQEPNLVFRIIVSSFYLA